MTVRSMEGLGLCTEANAFTARVRVFDSCCMARECVRGNITPLKPTNGVSLRAASLDAAIDHAQEVQHKIGAAGRRIDAYQALDPHDKADLFFDFSNNSVPRRLSVLDSTARQIPRISVRSMTEENPAMFIEDQREGADGVTHVRGRPNVGHERRLEACEARWKTSARWKG